MFFLIVLVVSAVRGVCTGPKCTGNSQTECAINTGCYWTSGGSGYCGGPEDACYGAVSQKDCNRITDCAWYAEGSYCSKPTMKECVVLSESECIADSGCLWYAASGQCSSPTWEQCASKTKAECLVEENGCEWYRNSGSCYFDGETCFNLSPMACAGKDSCEWEAGECYYSACESLSKSECNANDNCYYTPPEGYCRYPQNTNVCGNLNPTVCEATDGCVFIQSSYTCSSSNPDDSCLMALDDKGQTICDEGSSEGCSKKLLYAGYCASTTSYSCSRNAEGTGCSDSSSPGCIWDPTSAGGGCYPKDEAASQCQNNNNNTACSSSSPSSCSFKPGRCFSKGVSCQESSGDCTQTSKDAGCKWEPESETCGSSSYNALCYKNAEGTACETKTSAVCSFQSSPGYCGYNHNLVCSANEDGSACDAASSASGCKWYTGVGECYGSLTCYENSAGTACEGGDSGCKWHSATLPTCQSLSDDCFSNANGDGCAEYSTVLGGCVWKVGSAASRPIVHLPLLVLFFLLLFLNCVGGENRV